MFLKPNLFTIKIMRDNITFVFVILLFANSLFGQSSGYEKGYKSFRDVETYYEIHGNGEPLVILHGGPGLSHNYLMPHFQKLYENYNVIFYDQRASGKSTGSVDSNLTINVFVDDLEALRKSLGLEQFHLTGHSWGGLLALSYAVKYPQFIKSLTLISPVSPDLQSIEDLVKNRTERYSKEEGEKIQKLIASEELENVDSTVVEELLKSVFKVYLNDKTKLNLLDLSVSSQNSTAVLTMPNFIFPKINSPAIFDELKNLNVPTLIIHGTYDPLPSKYSEELSTIIPNSKLIIYENCGHFPFAEYPDKFTNDMLLFIGSND